MLYGLFAMVIGLAAILFSKFVMPKMQEKMDAKTKEVEAKRAQKKAEKAAAKEDIIDNN